MPNRILKLQTVKKNPISFLALGNDLSFRDRNGTGTLTASGALRYAPGPAGRVNLLPDPSFENTTLTTNWGWFSSGGPTITGVRDTTVAVHGSASAKLTLTTLKPFGTGSCLFWTSTAGNAKYVSPLKKYTISFVMWADVNGVSCSARSVMYDMSGAALGTLAPTGSTLVLSTTPTRFSITHTISNINTHQLRPQFNFFSTSGADLSATVWIDSVVVEEGDFGSTVPTYFDGSSPGCAWADPITGIAGTAHLSPSISRAAFWVEEATTNLALNPSAEVNTTSIPNWGGGTGSRVTTSAYVGSAAVDVVAAASVGSGVGYDTGTGLATVGQTYTGTVYVRASTAADVGKSVMTRFLAAYTDATTANLGSNVPITLTDAWQRITNTAAADGVKTLSKLTLAVMSQGTDSPHFLVDAAQIEQKAYATSYCDGSLGSGYTWSGTAHGSASTRALAQVSGTTATRVSSLQGTAVVAFNKALDDNRFSAPLHLGTYGTNDWLGVAVRTNTVDDLIFRSKVGTASERSVAAGAFSYGAWHTAIGDWNTSTIGAQLDASARVSASRVDTPTGVMGSTLNIGYGGSAEVINGFVGPVALFDRPLTSTEVALLQATDPRYWWDLLGP